MLTILCFYLIINSGIPRLRVNMKVCFIGHRHIRIDNNLISLVKDTITTLIKNGATTFLFGSKSEFDTLCYQIVTELKTEYPNINRIYVRSAFQDINQSYEEYLLKLYEYTYFPPHLENAGKSSYIKRNFEMITHCKYCVFYYNKHYQPAKRKSGTKIAYEYAVKNNKEIINLYR